jgi:cell shape-determining protein MreD
MGPLHSYPGRAATIGTAILGGVLLGQALDSTITAYAVVNAVVGALAALSAGALATRDSFDTRLAAGLVCAVTGFVALLAMLVGLPGSAEADVSLTAATLVACGVVVPVLLFVDHRCRLGEDGGPRPYAP